MKENEEQTNKTNKQMKKTYGRWQMFNMGLLKLGWKYGGEGQRQRHGLCAGVNVHNMSWQMVITVVSQPSHWD